MSVRTAVRPQRGAVLLVALVLMALVTLLAASLVRFSMSGVRLAVSEELRSDAFQNAQSLVDAAMAAPQNLMVTGRVGDTNCVAGVAGCTTNTLALRDDAGNLVTSVNLADSGSSIRVQRIAPEVSTPPRATGYSAVRFEASFLEVESGYDGTSGGWGKAEVSEGVTAIVPKYGG